MKTAFFSGLAMLALPILAATAADKDIFKKCLDIEALGPNLIRPDAWTPWQKGFTLRNGVIECVNGSDTGVQRGAGQVVVLNQKTPRPIVATASSRATGVTGGRNSDYSLYLDITYTDGTPKWGQHAAFHPGSHDWEKRRVLFVPEKPIRSVSCYVLLRRHGGTAQFRDVELRQMQPNLDAMTFDSIPVQADAAAAATSRKPAFYVRDVKARSDFLTAAGAARLGIVLTVRNAKKGGAEWFDFTVRDTTGADRALTVGYALPLPPGDWLWLRDARHSVPAAGNREFIDGNRFSAGVNGLLSRYPFGAVANGKTGIALCVDLHAPAFHRVGFNAASRDLFLSYDIALTPEKPSARLRFCRFDFAPEWGFRAAAAKMMALFPDAFRCRTPEQGIWMPFARISKVEGWQDFGFKFKEGTNEIAWDDAHDIITFRYTEPMTWWMRMPKAVPRTMEAARAYLKRLAEKGNTNEKAHALAVLNSGYYDDLGQLPARLRDTPWCNGAVWSLNSMPGIPGAVTDFKLKWNPKIRERYYGKSRKSDLDGEYFDSSEGYVTDELDFRRGHFAAARTPLVFATDSLRPAVFRGLIVFEYARAIEHDLRAMGKLAMANGTPSRLWWLAPLLDVMGTETNWKRGEDFQPMPDESLLYRRTLCGPKPYCFLMNTHFENFSHQDVEQYMKRCLAYGMFPGFFSHNASQGHYFTRPKLYNRDRPLFRKYIPLCKAAAEAGWQPVTLAKSSDPKVYVERFGTAFLTVYNDSGKPGTATVTTTLETPAVGRDRVSGRTVAWKTQNGRHAAELTLGPGDVALLDLRAAAP